MARDGYNRRVRPSIVSGVLDVQEALQGGDLQGENLVGLKPRHVPASHHDRLGNTGIEVGQGLRKRVGEDVGQGLGGERGPVVTSGGGVELEDDREHVGGSVVVWE